MFSNVINSVGAGSGINSAQLVEDLVAASTGAKLGQLNQRDQLNSTRISAMAATASALSTFAAAVKETLNGQGFVGDLVSTRTDLATAKVVDGGRPEGLPASVEIVQTASAQREKTDVFASASDPIGERTITINNSGGSFDIVIDSSNDSLAGLRDAINTSNSGVTASIITDKAGSRLVMEAREGADNSFTLTDAPAGGPILGTPLNFTNIDNAQDSIIRVDGIELTNSSNTVSGAIPGVEISLLAAEPGTNLTINGGSEPLDVRSLVTEFVTAYNELRSSLNDATAPGLGGGTGGPLAGDRGAREVIRQLGQLTSTRLSDTGEFNTLADIGVRTESDGTLSIDDARLDAALEIDADAIKLMLEPAVETETNIGLSGALDKISATLQDESGALAQAQERLDSIRESIEERRVKINDEGDRLREQLQGTFAGLERQLSVLRATQSYVEQQFASFNDNN
ncbi:flagellar filament capping protein FliD [Parasphingorhabdus cellanae]|uniref:Flagellar hook-associated protein 2 n=1 Tax=Parasphingorhabdus cellanae TaxID=2806553 RepID=A0ABX7T2S5_9SPHN|nr:flagellar filament capping protein FliD [Parasphingorhabdus cellanae]QTD55466.1 flagellar filament capping protein FliD [Parasphingorhabdus cellanae]